MASLDWTTFKAFVDAKRLSIQWAEDTSFYYLSAVDAVDLFSCKISRTLPGDSSDLSDFETNYKSLGNASVSLASDRLGSGSLTALNTTVVANSEGASTAMFIVAGTWVGTISVQGSVDSGTTWSSIVATGSGQSVFTTTTSNDNIKVPCGGFNRVRLIMSAYTSGTATVLWDAGSGIGPVQVWNTNATSLKVAPRSDTINSTGSAGSLNADLVASIDVGGYQTMELQVTGTFVGTITFQGSEDNSTFVSVSASNISNTSSGPVTNTTTTGSFYIPLTARYFRARMTSYTSGTANGAWTFDTMSSGDIQARNVLLYDSSGTGITIGQKPMSSGLPVVISSDQSAVPASQSGTWNINNVSGTVSLPTGASTSANQTTEITSLQIIDDAMHSQNASLNKGVPVMGQLDDTSTTAATEDNVAVARITAQRAIHVNLRDNSGTEKGTTTNPSIVAGTTATGAAVSGNPVRIGGKDGSGNTRDILTDTSGNTQVVGSVASAATDSGNPVKVGSIYHSSTQTFTDGQRADLQSNQYGQVTVNYRNTYSRTTGNTTTTAKSGSGTLHGVIVGANSTGGVGTIYDNTAGSGTIIMQLDFGSPSGGLLSTSGQPGPVFIGPLGLEFATGLTLVTTGSTSNDVTLVYR